MKECTWQEVKNKVQSINLPEQEIKAANIVLFGVGRSGESAHKKLGNICHIVAFSDNNPKLWGGKINGIEIIEPCRLPQIDKAMIIIAMSDQQCCAAVKKQLDELNIKCITYAEYVIANHFAEFEMVYEQLLEDECSKSTYRNILMSHLEVDPEYLKTVFSTEQQYFALPEFNIPSAQEVFVDCGAYVGDAMEMYIFNRSGTFKKMYLFEPVPKTYQALSYRRERLLKEWALEEEQIIVEKKAVSAEDRIVAFTNETNKSSSNRIKEEAGDMDEAIQAVSLDHYFENMEDKPSFIKADIEGMEGDLIQGAEGIIRENRPLIAICAYHNIEDLYELPLKIKQLNGTYKMAVRHHMPNACETVLYCY